MIPDDGVLVVGAGTAGLAVSILLARAGGRVEVAEIEPSISVLGSGITLQGNALRVLRDLGVWQEVSAHGAGYDTVGLRAPDGTLLFEIPDGRTGGPDLPAALGMRRPDLSAILVAAAIGAGVSFRLATTVERLRTADGGVDVTFSDGSPGQYGLVIGADGVRSRVRSLIGIETGPAPLGMGIWRMHAPRPASVTRTDLTYGGPCYIAGYSPTGPDSCYAYLVEDARGRAEMPEPADYAAFMTKLASDYHGPWDELRTMMDDPTKINYTQFEAHIVEPPWHRGRVVLIGDAAHSCPPTLAQGAAMALEDAAVLAELLVGTTDEESVLGEFFRRRIGRVRPVVDGSVQLAQWMLDHVADADVPGLMTGIQALVTRPA